MSINSQLFNLNRDKMGRVLDSVRRNGKSIALGAGLGLSAGAKFVYDGVRCFGDQCYGFVREGPYGNPNPYELISEPFNTLVKYSFDVPLIQATAIGVIAGRKVIPAAVNYYRAGKLEEEAEGH